MPRMARTSVGDYFYHVSIVAMVVLRSFMQRETIRRLSIFWASSLRTRCET